MKPVIRFKSSTFAHWRVWSLPLLALACAEAPRAGASGSGGVAGSAADSADGAAVFRMACQRCHGVDGRGDGPLSGEFGPIPDLNAADLGARYSRAALEALIRSGRGKMPAHSGRLGEVDLNAVFAHVERRFMGRGKP